MDKIGIIVLILFSGAIVFIGNKHWNETIAKEAVSEASVSGNIEEEVKYTAVEEINSTLEFAGNWSEQARNVLKSKQQEGIPFMISIVGTQAIDHPDYSIFANLSKQTSDVYGIDVKMGKYIYDGTSIDFVNEETAGKVNAANPDMIILKPAALADNGEVRLEHSVENLASIIADFKAHNPDVSVVLVDPLPLYEAVHYPKEVAEIRLYAEKNSIPYIHHWDKWQMEEGTEMEKYLKEDKRTPNEEGFGIWLEAIGNYLVKGSE